LYDEFGPLLTTVNIFAFVFSFFLYWLGKRSNMPERRSSNAFYGYFMGTGLNPRVGNFDLKLFCEARPGLILWILINLSFAAKQYQLHGTVTTPMLLVNARFTSCTSRTTTIARKRSSTWDIKHETSWMLCWGDLVWCRSCTRFRLVLDQPRLSVVAGNYRDRRSEHVRLRGLPRGEYPEAQVSKESQGNVWKPPEYIETRRGTLLLTSGWWGIARHCNYLGDLMMGLAWCLPTGFEHPLPYFYIAYFTILLVHREWRDNAMCQEKYGPDWDAYCRKVPWRIVPGIY
jgi:hypothetical protein